MATGFAVLSKITGQRRPCSTTGARFCDLGSKKGGGGSFSGGGGVGRRLRVLAYVLHGHDHTFPVPLVIHIELGTLFVRPLEAFQGWGLAGGLV